MPRFQRDAERGRARLRGDLILDDDGDQDDERDADDGDDKGFEEARLLLLLLFFSVDAFPLKRGDNLLRPPRARLVLRLGKHAPVRSGQVL